MSAIVVDASIALSLVYRDENSSQMEEILYAARDGPQVLLTAPHWSIELLSSLQKGVRRHRIRRQDRVPAFELLAALPISIVSELPHAGDLFPLADEASLSIYDALYLSLALREKAFLATADTTLAKAAAKRGVLWKPGRRKSKG